MITITIPYPGDPGFDLRHGPSIWRETLTDAPRIWQRFGYDLRQLAGMRSEDASIRIRTLVAEIMADPDYAIGVANYYDLRATVAGLTNLFFTLRERPEGTVQVS